jgi:hypothetical protein
MPTDGTSYARPDADGDSHARPNPEQASQGQNVKGMMWVLVIGIISVVAIFAAMVAISGGREQTDTSPAADINSESNAAVPIQQAPQ